MTEYVKLDPYEQVDGKKNLLYCQLEVLSIVKRYQKYKKLRKEELNLKTLLKKKIKELKEELKELDQVIPKMVKHKEDKPKAKKVSKKVNDKLQSEIDEIKRKIAALTAE